MKKIIIFFLLFFVFVTLINSYPHRNIRKRVERVGRFRQCSGTFPITYTEATYTPETIISVQLFTFFFFNDTATTEIYTLSLHDALPIPSTEKALRIAGLSIADIGLFEL